MTSRGGSSAQGLDRGGDPLVGGGDGDPDVLVAGAAVERARRHQDTALGQPGDGVPAGLVAGGPEVEGRLGVVDPEAGRLQGVAEDGSTRGIAGVLLLDM